MFKIYSVLIIAQMINQQHHIVYFFCMSFHWSKHLGGNLLLTPWSSNWVQVWHKKRLFTLSMNGLSKAHIWCWRGQQSKCYISQLCCSWCYESRHALHQVSGPSTYYPPERKTSINYQANETNPFGWWSVTSSPHGDGCRGCCHLVPVKKTLPVQDIERGLAVGMDCHSSRQMPVLCAGWKPCISRVADAVRKNRPPVGGVSTQTGGSMSPV